MAKKDYNDDAEVEAIDPTDEAAPLPDLPPGGDPTLEYSDSGEPKPAEPGPVEPDPGTPQPIEPGPGAEPEPAPLPSVPPIDVGGEGERCVETKPDDGTDTPTPTDPQGGFSLADSFGEITGFVAGTDKFVFSVADADVTTPELDKFVFDGAFKPGAPLDVGHITFFEEGESTGLAWNDGGPEINVIELAQLQGELTATDFVL